MPTFIGLDPSWTGFAGVRLTPTPRQPDYVVSELWATKPKDFANRIARLSFLVDKAAGFALNYPEIQEPIIVAIESYAFGSTNGRELAGELGGATRLALYQYATARQVKVRMIEVPPTVLKSFVTGKGNAEKSLILKEVFKKWGFDAPNDNAADAFALAKFAKAYSDETLGPKFEGKFTVLL